ETRSHTPIPSFFPSAGGLWAGRVAAFRRQRYYLFPPEFTKTRVYHPLADASHPGNNHHPILGGNEQKENPAHTLFSHVAHTHMLLLVGVGLRLVFLQEASYGSLGVSVLLSGLSVQWAILCQGFIAEEEYIYLDVKSLLAAETSGLSMCVSLSALVGVASPLQLLLLSLVHAPLHAANLKLNAQVLKTVDRGGSVSTHVFGAVFGVAARVALTVRGPSPPAHPPSSKGNQVMALIGTMFLVVYLPSIGSWETRGDDLHRRLLNTSLATWAAAVASFPASSVAHPRRKFVLSDIQCGLVGGVVSVVGVADFMLEPWGALLLGASVSSMCVLSRHYLRPCASRRVGAHDTASVGVSHGLAGVMGGLTGALLAALASDTGQYGFSLYEIFPAMSPPAGSPDLHEIMQYLVVEAGEGRTPLVQALFQLVAIVSTLAIAAAGGLLTGGLMRIPLWENLGKDDLLNDTRFWQLPVAPPPTAAHNPPTQPHQTHHHHHHHRGHHHHHHPGHHHVYHHHGHSPGKTTRDVESRSLLHRETVSA
ncbi:ammonium transporter Rh type C-like, partial [Penaeus japonicus]|uniref:ammonium transporter Rh type C-like n=1 Tax=Penaeus japonicus TaxID=27405 RepID=UPI001C714B21